MNIFVLRSPGNKKPQKYIIVIKNYLYVFFKIPKINILLNGEIDVIGKKSCFKRQIFNTEIPNKTYKTGFF